MTDSTSVTPTDTDLAFTRETARGTIAEPAYAGALSFMRRRYTRDLADADVAVMGVPFDLAVSGRSGARLGPRAIRAASSHIAWSAPWPWEFDPFERLAVVDCGDCFFDPGYPAQVPDAIAQAARDVLATDTALLTLGGDHFITWPLLKAHAERHGPLSLIQIDAHSDTWEDAPGRIDHGTMLWHAVREGLVVPETSVQVGIRTHNPDPLGLTVYMVTHDLDSLFTVADRIAVLGEKRVLIVGTIEDMLKSEDAWVKSYFRGKRARHIVMPTDKAAAGMEG